MWLSSEQTQVKKKGWERWAGEPRADETEYRLYDSERRGSGSLTEIWSAFMSHFTGYDSDTDEWREIDLHFL